MFSFRQDASAPEQAKLTKRSETLGKYVNIDCILLETRCIAESRLTPISFHFTAFPTIPLSYLTLQAFFDRRVAQLCKVRTAVSYPLSMNAA